MKYKGLAFFSMVLLALGLMALFVITQFFTNKSTQALNNGNHQAVETFKLNNGIQELVNLSFVLQTKLKNHNLDTANNRIQRIKDSLTMLGYNANILTGATTSISKELSSLINKNVEEQLNISEKILDTYKTGSTARKNLFIDSLYKVQPGDKIYENCVALQALLKKNLQDTLTKNSEQAGKLSRYNRILALLAIITILIMATIIIKRQAEQLKLIDDLKLAEKAALKSKNAKDEFLANMSHELRTPLNALIGFGNLLDDTPLDQQQKEYVEMIRSSGHNLLNIVNDVLDISKIEAGKLTIVHKPFNLYEFFNRIEKMFAVNIKQKGLQYQSYIDASVPEYVIGDPERLQQIFVNLIGNAIKFTNKGSILVSASIVWSDEDTRFYKLGFTVKDTGAGIPKDKMETIFERFEQLEHGTQRQYGGAGLGLTIVRNLVEKMGGSISVYSEINEGSEFNFTCVFEKALLPQTEAKQEIVTRPVFSKYSVLLVEDNRANQILLRHTLKKYDLHCYTVDNGKEAVRILEKEKFDLIFMDIQMPMMDGYTTINIILNKLKIQTPVIAMTAYVSENEILKCREAGFQDYLAKPIDEKLLLEKTEKYLNGDKNTNGSTLTFLKGLVGDDPKVISEVLHEMKTQWDTDKKDLIDASSKSEEDEIGKVLHRLRSTFSPLGPDHIIFRIVNADGGGLSVKKDFSLNNCICFIEKIDKEVHIL